MEAPTTYIAVQLTKAGCTTMNNSARTTGYIKTFTNEPVVFLVFQWYYFNVCLYDSLSVQGLNGNCGTQNRLKH